uniref:Large ribosomal subunit protein eL22 n=2 Tax=Hemiselmis andersenii TaxID=464988 RepID=A0A7S0TG10_HEMAN
MPPVKKGAPVKGKAGQKGKKSTLKFYLDCTTAETDSILDVSNFEKYLKENIKVMGKAGNLGDAVVVGKEKSKITVTSEMAFSKRYLKYLAKKYLKKHQMRDFLRVVSTNKSTYELKYYHIEQNDADEDSE